MTKAPVYKYARFRPWLWPVRFLGKLNEKRKIPLGLWIINKFFQSVLDINNDIPWMVHYTSRVSGNIKIGENVWLSFAVSGGCYIQGFNGVIIGDNTIFAPGIKIVSANHDPNDLNKSVKTEPVRIGKNCWIGSNAIILPSVSLGDNVIVGAGAVVTKSFSDNSVIVGNPARQI